jgi:hypothetical protein
MSQFKIGDKVKVNKPKYGTLYQGIQGEVCLVERDSVTVHFPETPIYVARKYTFLYNELDLVKPKEMENKDYYIVERSFLKRAYDAADGYWKDIIIDILKRDVFSDELVVPFKYIKQAYEDKDICQSWKEELKLKFPDVLKNDKIYEFSVGQTIDTIYGSLPFMIGYKCLIVSTTYEVMLSNVGGTQKLTFKKKS